MDKQRFEQAIMLTIKACTGQWIEAMSEGKYLLVWMDKRDVASDAKEYLPQWKFVTLEDLEKDSGAPLTVFHEEIAKLAPTEKMVFVYIEDKENPSKSALVSQIVFAAIVPAPVNTAPEHIDSNKVKQIVEYVLSSLGMTLLLQKEEGKMLFLVLDNKYVAPNFTGETELKHKFATIEQVREEAKLPLPEYEPMRASLQMNEVIVAVAIIDLENVTKSVLSLQIHPVPGIDTSVN